MGDRCIYNLAWRGQCERTDTTDGLCPEHTGKRCAGCGAVAVRECCETFQFVCCFPLCPSCAHIYTPGVFGSLGHGRHGWRNGEQVEVPHA